MSIPVTLHALSSGNASVDLLNENFETIEAGLVNALSRTGDTPNTMQAVLDMNSKRIINLPNASAPQEPVTYAQFQAASSLTEFDTSISTYTHSATGAVERTVSAVLERVISPEDFGAVGNDSTNDATSIQEADSAAAGGVVMFTPGKIYRVTSEITCTGEWNLCGAKIHLVLDGNVRGIEMDDNSWIHNGIVKKTSTGTVSSGEYQCHIKAGKFDTPTGKENVRVSDLVLEKAGTVVNDNGIVMATGTHNFVIENITVRTSATLGRAVMCHWGNLASYASTGTGHPHNGIIRNIYSEGMTYTGAGQALVYLSGCYNVTTENCHADYIAYSLITDYAGDRGWRYASAGEQAVAQKGNVFRNCMALECGNNSGQIVFLNGEPVLETSYLTYPNTVFDGITIIGTASGANTNGFEIANAGKAVIKNSVARNFTQGIVVGTRCVGTAVENCEFSGNASYGINVSDNSVPPEDILVAGNYCHTNATAGIRVSEAYRATIRDNELGDRDGTDSTQDYGVQIGTADRGHEIVNNQFHAYTVAGIQTATSAGQFVDVINGNTFDGLAAPIRGQDFIPYARVPTPDGTTILWHGVGNTTPEGSVTAPVGSSCMNTANGKHYMKTSGTGNTGWTITGTQS